MNITFIIGHRGTGKTSYLKKLQRSFATSNQESVILDLDDEIQRRESRTIDEIFKTQGEAGFRVLEQKTLNELFKIYNGRDEAVFISIGAGYSGAIPDPAHIIWLQRPTDQDGRIFLDRPRLQPEVSAFEEYRLRLAPRNFLYSGLCDEQLMRLEGFEDIQIWDEVFFGLRQARMGGGLTLLPEHFKRFSSWGAFIERRLTWGVDFFEIRDDLLDQRMIRLALQEIRPEKLLLSFRSSVPSILQNVDLTPYSWDWPLELGLCSIGVPRILSLHRKEEGLDNQLETLEVLGKKSHLKLAIEIDTWQELERCHDWWREDPVNRSFLPRSRDGRWMWYRSLFGHQMKVAFFREDVGSALDQPYFSEWIRTQGYGSDFAAVLGDPVHQSHTPALQENFFKTYNMPVVAIQVEEHEDTSYVLQVLAKMGLKAAAVTSPLKTRVVEVCKKISKQAQQLESVNTLWRQGEEWLGENTDVRGFEALLSGVAGKKICVWGGGGTRLMIQRSLPGARFYSARTGEVLDESQSSEAPHIVVWAVPRSRMSECLWPDVEWKPELVIDLNYTMDSPGREYALSIGAKYRSGEAMFLAQGLEQQKFWRTHLDASSNKEIP